LDTVIEAISQCFKQFNRTITTNKHTFKKLKEAINEIMLKHDPDADIDANDDLDFK